MPLVLRDTLTGKIEPVAVDDGGPLRLYVCGPTAYEVAHVGHASTYLFFDVVRRFLREENVPVRHVMNITDFEDKITDRARALGTDWRDLSRTHEARFFADMDRLGVLRPHVVPRASDFVPQMIQVIRRLERLGRVHREGNEWFFRPRGRADGRNFPVGRELAAHAVPEPDHALALKGPGDREFMVWKRQETPAPSWASPWGNGMPGWHLECFTMAERFLGVPVDLHGGGTDLIYPHHYAENEIALALASRLFSRRFLHTAFVTADGVKMSKSVGIFLPLNEALDEYGADALRFYLLGRPFHTRLEWSHEEATRALELLTDLKRRLLRLVGPSGTPKPRLAEVRDLRLSMAREIGENLGMDRAFEKMLRWVETRPDRVRKADASRRQILEEFERIELLTGIRWLELGSDGDPASSAAAPKSPVRSPARPRAKRRAR